LHLGHAYAAILAHDMAVHEGGKFLLRIEDIDQSRARPAWEQAIYDDLEWLGLTWEEPVIRQSERLSAYWKALNHLWARDLLYPCTCTRRDIAEALSAPQEGIVPGPDGPVYPGTCRDRDWPEFMAAFKSDHPCPERYTLRLNMGLAATLTTEHHIVDPATPWVWTIDFHETGDGPHGEHGWIETDRGTLTEAAGDVVLSRRDMGTSYHLSVVVDDAAQGITHVTRGDDLFEATKIHVVLQRLLDLPTPTYHHHRLIRDDHGKRLAKRDDARALSKYRAEGVTPQDIRRMVGLQPKA
jgi:glutamyl-Q tRNA(Asp) synthetase